MTQSLQSIVLKVRDTGKWNPLTRRLSPATLCGFSHCYCVGCEIDSVESWATLILLSPDAYLNKTSLYTQCRVQRHRHYYFSASSGQRQLLPTQLICGAINIWLKKHVFVISLSDHAFQSAQPNSVVWQWGVKEC